MMSLTMATPGSEVRLVAINGDVQLKQRLADLGMNIGMTVCVMADSRDGRLIVAVKDSRLALGRGVAHKVMVESTKVTP
ncbi:MAG: ferrous iron transport protein A [Chloroflexi bacterium]|nr:ferrous iron transport protein A [Chloroflexota bacterium]